MRIRVLGESHSIINQYLAEIRDISIQKDRLRFRENIHRLGELFAYEISKELKYSMTEVTTPGNCKGSHAGESAGAGNNSAGGACDASGIFESV